MPPFSPIRAGRGFQLAILLAAATWAFDRAAAGDSARPPLNVVVIVSDDQGWGDYGFMGHPHIRTPHIDRLAAESLTFTRGYVPSSLCRPSLASLVSGLHAHQHRIVGNDPQLPPELAALTAAERVRDPRWLTLRRDYAANLDHSRTLPGLWTAEGWLAHQSGKWWEQDWRFGRFTHGMTHGDPTRGGRHGDEGLKIGRETMRPVLDFLDEAQRASKPCLVFYAPMLPHLPQNPPERLLERFREGAPSELVARYWAMCAWFDESVGVLLDGLDERGMRDNTLVLYVADNGWTQPESGEIPSYGGPRGKRSPYDGGLRTPILLRWPGRIAARREDARLASSLDVLPTVLAAAGIAAPGELPGINLLDDEALSSREAVEGAIFDHDATLPTRPAETLQFRWMVTEEWKLILPERARAPEGRVELFRIVEDPHESRDLSEERPEVVRALRERLDGWWDPGASGSP
ncbi:MAG: sulfatase-like hydrolase/transferase [Planctomyces sp.]|nr:sulfatase-like hydrolase/transferase [Planctomyces sp.]